MVDWTCPDCASATRAFSSLMVRILITVREIDIGMEWLPAHFGLMTGNSERERKRDLSSCEFSFSSPVYFVINDAGSVR